MHRRSGRMRARSSRFTTSRERGAQCWSGQARPDASLEVSRPLQRSLATSRCPTMPSPDDPASALGGRRRLLRPACLLACPTCTHAAATSTGPCGFTLVGSTRSTGARVVHAARVCRVDRPDTTCRCIGHVVARRGSCAGAVLVSRRSATRSHGHVAWSVPFRCRSFCEFPSRERGRP